MNDEWKDSAPGRARAASRLSQPHLCSVGAMPSKATQGDQEDP
jgi:hypothetical protein